MAQYDSFKDLFGTNDPEEYRKKLALGLATEGISGAPIGHWTQGLNRMANAALAGYLMNKFSGDKQDSLYDEIDANRALTGQEPLPRPNKNGLFDTFRKLGSSDQKPSPGYTTAAQPNDTRPPDDKEGAGFITSVPPGGTPLPPGRPVYDRTRANAEIQADPAIAMRMRTMAQGEVGKNPNAQLVEMESAANRDEARNSPANPSSLAKQLKIWTGPGSTGYYPSQTFTNGIGSQNALAEMLRGSDAGGQALGFSPTGNASGDVARSGERRGYYTNVGKLGSETFVNQRPDNMQRLEATRLPANYIPPDQARDVANASAALPPGAQYASLPPGPGLPSPQPLAQQQPQQAQPPVQLAQAQQGPGPQPRAGIGQFPPETLRQLEILDRQGMAGNKFAARQAQQIRQQLMTPDTYQMHTAGENVVRFNPRTGASEVIGTTGKPTHGVVGSDKYGNHQYGWTDPRDKSVTYDSPQQAPANPAMDMPTGPEFLQTLDKPKADTVRAITEGRIAPPGAFALKTPYWQQMMEHVAQYEPGFDLTAWSSRKKTRDEFSAGGPNSVAGTITAGNTAIQHLGQLSDASEKLSNVEGFSLLNKPINMGAALYGEYSQDPRYSNFNTIRDKYVTEAAKFYRGSGLAEADIKRELSTLYAAQGPTQLREAIAKQTELMQSKIDALQERWKQSMGPNAGEYPLIHDKSKKEIDKIMGRAYGNPEAGARQPERENQTKQYKKGDTATNPKTGQKIIFDGEQWVAQ